MACTDIVVKVVGDNQFITDQVTTVTDKAKEVTDTAAQVKQDSDAAKQSSNEAKNSASEAAKHLADIKDYQNPFYTKNKDTLESTTTKGYNFKGGGVTVTEISPDEFEIDIPKTGDMLARTYDPNSVNADAFDRANHKGELPISTITDLQSSLDSKLEASEYTEAEVKQMYESNADTNAFTDAEKTKLNAVDPDVDMKTSVYDPKGVNADAFDPKNFDFSQFPDKTVLTVVGGKLANSDVTASEGSLQTGANSISAGGHTLSSAGENFMFRNEWTGGIYTTVWQKVERNKNNLPQYRMYTDSKPAEIVINDTRSDVVVNPSFSLTAIENTRVWSFILLPAENIDNVFVHVEFLGKTVWRKNIGTFIKDVPFRYDLESNTTPIDVYKGQSFTIHFEHENGRDISLYGDKSSNIPYLHLIQRYWKFVDVGAGGSGSGDMQKSIYDPNDDGSVLLADNIKGASAAGNSKYYGTDNAGTPGFYDLPVPGPSEPADYSDLKRQVQAHETSINNHGVEIAQHENEISANTRNIRLLSSRTIDNANAIDTTRKNAVSGFSLEQDKNAKTITIKMTTETGIVDTGVINLAGWFDDSGSHPPAPDYTVYYGFSANPPMSESEILRLGTKVSTPTIAGLDIRVSRTDQSSKYIWVWLPDSAGVIKGFTFSGFLSVWASTAVTVAGDSGKFYQSPNPTVATNINFEVTK
ncbi:hypothetical protein [Vibrio phage vB_VpM-pA2SJ1]|uniref:Tail fiber protein n=1 Tax=Vibrio phage vB_VpM-pA2SJ1 TaxID=3095964 RepID=A0AAX4J577_9CAUD